MACLFLFALYLGEIKEKVSKQLAQHYIRELLALPQKTQTILDASDQVEKLAELYYRVDDFMFSVVQFITRLRWTALSS